MRTLRQKIIFVSLLAFGGCATGSPKGTASEPFPSRESARETISAAEAVAGAVSGQDLTEQDLRRVARQVQSDPEAKRAVESISGALTSSGVGVKYCPIDGRRYDGRFSRCPEHDVPLKELEE